MYQALVVIKYQQGSHISLTSQMLSCESHAVITGMIKNIADHYEQIQGYSVVITKL